MPCEKKTLKMWARIVAGSKLEVWVEPVEPGGPENFVASATWENVFSGTAESWTDGELRPGPKTKTLQAGQGYIARVRVDFRGNETDKANIRAKVTKPDGSAHGDPFCCEVSGKVNERRRATITAAVSGGG
ncbi:MAG: hypothetical protein MJB57_07195 [Gemmatimonadetes bacterium]|nr:hypothetical protein [Gemmatimonadota bacterium]